MDARQSIIASCSVDSHKQTHTVGPGGRAVYGVSLQPLARIAGSHPAESTNRACVAHGSSVCEGLITRTEESYRVCRSNCVM